MSEATNYNRQIVVASPVCRNCDASERMEATTLTDDGQPYPYRLFWMCPECGAVIAEEGGIEGAVGWLIAWAAQYDAE